MDGKGIGRCGGGGFRFGFRAGLVVRIGRLVVVVVVVVVIVVIVVVVVVVVFCGLVGFFGFFIVFIIVCLILCIVSLFFSPVSFSAVSIGRFFRHDGAAEFIDR